MVNSKTNSKVLLIVGIIFLSVFIFNMNTVNATNEGIDNEIKKVIDVIPDTIDIDIPEIEADSEKATKLFVEEVEKIWKNNNINVKEEVKEQLGIYARGINEVFAYSKDEIFVGHITQNYEKDLKTVKLVCNDHNKYNAKDEEYVKSLKIEDKKYFEVDLDFVKNSGNDENSLARVVEQYYESTIGDKSIDIRPYFGSGFESVLNAGGMGGFAIFKGGILYDAKRIDVNCIPVITIPSTFSEDKIEEYVIDVLKPYYKKTSLYKCDENSLKLIKGIKDIPDGYTVSCKIDGKQENESSIIIKKEQSKPITSTDKTTNIKIEISMNVVPSDTIMETTEIKEDKIINVVKKALKEISNKFTSYDITLKSEGVAIQPNGKVKISIPIPADYNKEKLVVYRIDENGDKTKYAVAVSGDYATFETDHFSTYVLAEQQGTKKEHKLDDEPNSGVVDSYMFIAIVVSISLISLAVYIKKNK